MGDLKVQPGIDMRTDLSSGYRDTEIGPLPIDWEVMHLGDVLNEVTVRVRDFREDQARKFPVLSLTKNEGLILQSERFGKRIATENVEDYKVVQQDQIVYNPYVIWEGAVHILRKYEHGLVSPVYPVWEAQPDVADPVFVDAFLRTPLAIAAYNRFAAGAVNRRRAIRKKDFLSIQVPLPPLPEQKAIAHVLRTIQKAIETTEQIIEASRELKRSLMNHLFTYGPVPVDEAEQVPLKETEIGLVPEHWETVELGRLIARGPQNGLYKPASAYGDGTPILRIDAFDAGDTVSDQYLKRLRLTEDEKKKYELISGDIVINRVNGSLDLLGKCAIVEQLSEPTVFESNMMKLAVNPEMIGSQFSLRFLCSSKARKQIIKKARIIHQASINQQDLKSLLVCLPPLTEQEEIVHMLRTVDERIAAEENRKQTLDVLFKTLLHNLMTGKVRVKDLSLSKVEEMV